MRFNSKWPGADVPAERELHLWPREASQIGYDPPEHPEAFCGLEYHEEDHGRIRAVSTYPYADSLAEFFANERGGELCKECLANALYLHGFIGTGGPKAAEILVNVEVGGGLRVDVNGEELTLKFPDDVEITVDEDAHEEARNSNQSPPVSN